MSAKINFLEKSAFVLTYRKALIMIGIWFVLCIAIFGILSGYSWYLGKNIIKKQAELKELNVRKERTMALVEASRSRNVETNVAELTQIYTHYPVWSSVMVEISKNMPHDLKLTAITSEYLSPDSMVRKLEMSGTARSTASITGFVERLSENRLFSNVVLSSTTMVTEGANSGYSFVILAEVNFGARKWS